MFNKRKKRHCNNFESQRRYKTLQTGFCRSTYFLRKNGLAFYRKTINFRCPKNLPALILIQ